MKDWSMRTSASELATAFQLDNTKSRPEGVVLHAKFAGWWREVFYVTTLEGSFTVYLLLPGGPMEIRTRIYGLAPENPVEFQTWVLNGVNRALTSRAKAVARHTRDLAIARSELDIFSGAKVVAGPQGSIASPGPMESSHGLAGKDH